MDQSDFHALAFGMTPCHHNLMARQKGGDFATIARTVVEKAIGEHLDGSPLEDASSKKNPAAVRAGKKGGEKGGNARAQVLTAEQRRQIAVKAARARWKTQKDE